MGFLDKIMEFESQPLSQIIYNIVKWFQFEKVNMETFYRPNVESTVWMAVKIEREGKTWYVEGQRIDIVKRRLIEFLEREKVRPEPENKPEN